MTLIIRNRPPFNTAKDSGNPKPERQHMPNWERWKNKTIEQLKNSKAAAAKDEQKGGK